MKRLLPLLLASALFTACAASKKPDKITRELLSLSKEQVFEKGKALFARKKYEKGRKYLSFVFESYPNDPLGQRALMMVADGFFAGGRKGFIEARYRYRDYLTRYPSAPDRDYARYRYALCYDKDHEPPDRDSTNTREAISQYQTLLKESPASIYAAKARERAGVLGDLLAEHEFAVGFFYYRKGDPAAALGRFQWAEGKFPHYSGRDKLYYYAGRALLRLHRAPEADRYFAHLDAEFPQSRWTTRARKENHISVDKPTSGA